MKQIELATIAMVESCYKQKFAIPRQPGLAPSATAKIRLLPDYALPEAFEGIEQSSHIWLQFVFHQAISENWSPRVRPPRLGGNRKLGVFATRSTHRPNPIGLSVVRLDSVDTSDGVVLNVSGIDLLDGTPVLDIKPYVPYADAVGSATQGYAGQAPEHMQVNYSDQAHQQISAIEQGPGLDEGGDLTREQLMGISALITEILRQDPRPAYQAMDTDRIYGTLIYGFNLRWQYQIIAGKETIKVIAFDRV